ncbi:MAG: oligosaccharide flippase family protein [Candidatus Paceibacterota bacterium]|jgi:O-antigen/teichoic acid export membrane protein
MDRLIKKYKPRYQAFLSEKFSNDGSGWLMLQQLIIAPMSLITTVLLARILSISDYGYYKYVLSMYAIISLFGFGGIYNITIMNIQRGEDHFFSLGFKYKKILRWIPSIISLFVAIYYFYNGNNFLAIFFILAIFSYLIVDTYDFYLVALQGKGNFKLNALLGIFYYFISFFPPIITAYFTHNLYLVFITMYVCQGLFRIFGFNYVKRKNLIHNKNEEKLTDGEIKKWGKESLSLSFNSALNSLGGNVSSVVVFNRLGAINNAIYSLALALVDFVSGIIISTFSKSLLVLSHMSKENMGDNYKIHYIKSLFKKYFVLALLATLCSMLALPFIYKFLFAKYLFSYKYAVVYSLSLLALTFAPALYFFTEKRKFKIMNTVQIIVLLLNITSIFFAAMYFGVWGAIIVAISIKFLGNFIYTTLL